MKAMLLALALLQAPVERDLSPRPEYRGRFEVRVTRDQGVDLLTIRADEAEARDVLEAVARELGRELTGFEQVGRCDPLTAYLVERPVEDALYWIAGAVGLRVLVRPERIQVNQELPPFASQAEIFDATEMACLRALASHPDHAEAPAALMAKARVQESRGNSQAAVDEYEALINGYHQSPLLAQAMANSAHALQEIGDWRAAASRLDELASLPRPHPFHVEARVELAEALCEIGDAQKAIYTLDALEVYLQEQMEAGNPLDSPRNKVRRLIQRARAQAHLGKPVEAQRTLDLARNYDADGDFDSEILAVRAVAFELGGHPAEASVAWLKLAEEGRPELRAGALASAARLALESGDSVGTLFVHRYAQGVGLEQVTEEYAAAARGQVGLGTTPAPLNVQQLFIESEDLVARGEYTLAARRFAGLYERRTSLSDEEVVRLARGYAGALARDGMLDTAISAIRGLVALLPDAPQERQALYRLAADLYERAERYDDALEALRGRL